MTPPPKNDDVTTPSKMSEPVWFFSVRFLFQIEQSWKVLQIILNFEHKHVRWLTPPITLSPSKNTLRYPPLNINVIGHFGRRRRFFFKLVVAFAQKNTLWEKKLSSGGRKVYSWPEPPSAFWPLLWGGGTRRRENTRSRSENTRSLSENTRSRREISSEKYEISSEKSTRCRRVPE